MLLMGRNSLGVEWENGLRPQAERNQRMVVGLHSENVVKCGSR